MNIRIDDYYISVDNQNTISICIDGQMIIQQTVKSRKREDIIHDAVRFINDYNDRHSLEWGGDQK